MFEAHKNVFVSNPYGSSNGFVGMQLDWSNVRYVVHIRQRKYKPAIFERFGNSDSKQATRKNGSRVSASTNEQERVKYNYQHLVVGSLLFSIQTNVDQPQCLSFEL